MSKVLVFESDPVFAGELRTELGRLGFAVTVVDDGNLGLATAQSDRPDLILLSIELPRMNGFSVCNKLKKDPTLKDVPLVIMSSESSDETFEQHRKLRTRAEDYVHKPIAFGELLLHLRQFVPIDEAAPDSGAIALDDALILDEGETAGLATAPPPGDFDPAEHDTVVASARLTPVEPMPAATSEQTSAPPDPEIDAFIGGAFDRLLAEEEEERTVIKPAGAFAAEMAALRAPRTLPPAPTEEVPTAPPVAQVIPRPARAPSIPPARLRVSEPPPRLAPEGNEAEHLRTELARAKQEVVELTKAASNGAVAMERLGGELAEVRAQAAEAARYKREADELRTRAASATPQRAGTVSSREFLDLREALNAKDKEILGLRDQLTRKERELLDLRDLSLSFEREKADQEDRFLAVEREKAEIETIAQARDTEARERIDAFARAVQERDAALIERDARATAADAHYREVLARTVEEGRSGVDAAVRAERERAERERAELQARAAEAQTEALTRLDDEHATRLRNAVADERARSLAEQEERERSHAAALASQEATHAEALASITMAHAEALAAAAEAQADALEAEKARAAEALAERESSLVAAHAEAVANATAAHEAALASAADAHTEALTAAQAAHAVAFAATEAAHAEALQALESSAREERAEHEEHLRELRDRTEALGAEVTRASDEVARLGGELAASEEQRSAAETARDALAAELATTQARVEALEAHEGERSAELEATREEVTRLGTELERRRAELTEARERLEDTEELVRELEGKVASSSAERDTLLQDKDALEQELGRARTQLEKARVRWGEDRDALGKAREALGLAVEQLRLTVERPLDD